MRVRITSSELARFSLFLAGSVVGGSVVAQSTVPVYDSFANLTAGQQAVINFNGMGLNNIGPVATSGNGNFTLALSATPRTTSTPTWDANYTGPPVTHNGAGTYFAQTGVSPNAGSDNAGWNWNYAIVGNTTGHYFRLFADVDPAVATPASSYLNFTAALGAGAAGSSSQSTQNSQNLGFGAPAFYAFNPNSTGEYHFSIRAFKSADNSFVDEVAIRVTVVPEPEAYGLALAGMGVVGFAMLRRRRVPATV
jgi:hypothetical protein